MKQTSHIFVKALIIIMILFIAGCEGFNSPTGPADPFNDLEYGVKSAPGGTLHAILVADTDSNLSRILSSDLHEMGEFVEEVASYTGLMLNKHIYSGANATANNIRTGVHQLPVAPDDVVIFYFTGHGGRMSSKVLPWPTMYFHHDAYSGGLDVDEVFGILRQKTPRLLLTMSDTCNTVSDIAPRSGFAEGPSPRANKTIGYQKLFLESRAAIIVTSSQPGEESYATSSGSLFTGQFLQTLEQKVSGSNPTWSDVMASATRRIANRQHPQYELY